MNKLSFITLFLFSFFLSCNAQRTEQKDIVPFNKLYLSGNIDVIYYQSDTLSLTASGTKTDIEKLNILQKDNSLFLSNSGSSGSKLTLYIKNKTLSVIQLSGASNINASSAIRCDTLTINSSGASSAKLKLNAQKIDCILSGASEVNLQGNTNYLQALTSGASTFKGYNLLAVNATVISSGASTAKINAQETISANATGASSIKIKGDAKEIISETTPGATISKINKTNKSNSDTVSFNWKKKKFVIISGEEDILVENKLSEPKSFKHWKGVLVGINGYMNANGAINIPKQYSYMELNYARSFNIQLNSFEQQFNIIDNYFKFIFGLGLDFHLYQFNNKTILNADSSFTFGHIDSTNSFSYKKNRLRNTYLQIPLLFELNTSNNPNKTFHLAFGVIGELLLGSSTKQNLEQNKYEITKVRNDSYNINPFAAKAHVNFGYKSWTAYAEYNLTPLFQPGKGPTLYPFSVGLRVIPFS